MLKMFNLIDIGERAGSGIPNIFRVWHEQKWTTPEITEQLLSLIHICFQHDIQFCMETDHFRTYINRIPNESPETIYIPVSYTHLQIKIEGREILITDN